jgi:hypothetical protein
LSGGQFENHCKEMMTHDPPHGWDLLQDIINARYHAVRYGRTRSSTVQRSDSVQSSCLHRQLNHRLLLVTRIKFDKQASPLLCVWDSVAQLRDSTA